MTRFSNNILLLPSSQNEAAQLQTSKLSPTLAISGIFLVWNNSEESLSIDQWAQKPGSKSIIVTIRFTLNLRGHRLLQHFPFIRLQIVHKHLWKYIQWIRKFKKLSFIHTISSLLSKVIVVVIVVRRVGISIKVLLYDSPENVQLTPDGNWRGTGDRSRQGRRWNPLPVRRHIAASGFFEAVEAAEATQIEVVSPAVGVYHQ